MSLNTEPNIAAPDEFYQALIDAHAGLTEPQSAALNARLSAKGLAPRGNG